MDSAAYESMRLSQDKHWWFVGRRTIVRSLIERFAKPPESAVVLEAGCGFGGNLPLLEDYGQVHAFEFNEQARTYAASQTSGRVHYGALPGEIGFGDTKFDLIAILDVLEHIDDDLGSLAALRDRLSDDGSLLITVPAVPGLWSDHDEVHHHKRRYSRRELEAKLAQVGLVPKSVGYFNSLLFPLALAQRLSWKVSGSKADGDAPPGAINGLLTAIFSFESRLLSWLKFPIGLSLYAVVQKAAPQA